MIEHNCRCPGCGECDAHLRKRIAQPKKRTTPPGNASVVNEAVAAERKRLVVLIEADMERQRGRDEYGTGVEHGYRYAIGIIEGD